MEKERTSLYICDRHAACTDDCQARILGRPLDDETVCQRTSEIEHSLTRQLGIAPSWSVDAVRADLFVETTEHIFDKYLVVPVNEVVVEGQNA